MGRDDGEEEAHESVWGSVTFTGGSEPDDKPSPAGRPAGRLQAFRGFGPGSSARTGYLADVAEGESTRPELPWMIAVGVLGVALVVALVLAFTGGEEEPVVTTVAGGSTSTMAETEEGEDEEELDPPTDFETEGEPAEWVAVVVDNAPGARPQVGLGDEPLLVEFPVEGGLTRFVAVVPSGTEGLIGPVRSLRPVNASLTPALASALITSGGQEFLTRSVIATGVTLVTPFEIPSFVSLGRDIPHDTFIDLGDLATYYTPLPQVLGIPFGGELPAASGETSRIDMPYPGVAFTYDPDVGYVREQDGAPFEVLDPLAAQSGVLSHDTVVMLWVAQRAAGYTDSNDFEVADFDVVGSGGMVVLHAGEVFEGTWSRSAVADPYVFRSVTGQPFGLPEGRTYIAIVNRDEAAAISGALAP